ncbi:hypothetical protein N7449_011846 [Penicillium cf. viridicatum]|uniref:Uncharacterized protein n=1 Tax=Penicillium cf. viridicatum TaxID=2972119 RepID=A0A9W9IPL4_9EURO|nr:hypothetical protein N7449_011846 [Penicillium cf. viridicatum]
MALVHFGLLKATKESKSAQRSYFFGRFNKTSKRKRPVEFAEWIATFELAKPVPSVRWVDDDWDKDTSRWKW